MGRGFLIDELRFTPRVEILSDEQMDRFHNAALEILERLGVRITHPKGLELLDAAGCKIVGNQVYYPPWVVEKALAMAPHRLSLGNRDNTRAVQLDDRRSYFGPTLDCIFYQDPETGERSPCDSPHVKIMSRLCDKLDNYDWNMTLGLCNDYPPTMADKVASRLAMEFCRKPTVCCCADVRSLEQIYEMAVLLQGGVDEFERHPYLLHLADPVSPLLYYDPVVAKMIYCAEKKIPLINYPGIQAAGTSPATLAGTIVQASAEALSGLVLHQMANPGAPFIYGAFATIMDMRTTVFSYGAIEMAMMVGAMAQISQRYRLPFFGTAGCTDSQMVDIQAGVEGALQDLVSAGVGEGLIHDTHCWLDHGSTVSPSYMVLGQEILGMVKQFMGGITVNEDTLALDVIGKVGSGGNFLREKHTMKNFKSMFYSDLFDRLQYESWQNKGGKFIEERLKEKTMKVINSEDENPVDPALVKELDERQKSWEKW
ncbi:MAG: trimethylamine methyltransferase family protein [Deltaproteobacteria bacterium]|jgi:trimethylamine--corrinoid protein Co-methyltransferase|nr:trimethylamine methyltransferase family protein [Deltaproteobacteria bacterium]